MAKPRTLAFVYRPFSTHLKQTPSFLFYAGAYIYRVVKHALWGPPRRPPPGDPQKEGLYISLFLYIPQAPQDPGPGGPLRRKQWPDRARAARARAPQRKKERKKEKKRTKNKNESTKNKNESTKGGCQSLPFYLLSVYDPSSGASIDHMIAPDMLRVLRIYIHTLCMIVYIPTVCAYDILCILYIIVHIPLLYLVYIYYYILCVLMYCTT